MNPMELIQMIPHLPNVVWDAALRLGGSLPSDLICSMTVQTSLLVLVLLGAIRLVLPYESRGPRTARRKG